METISTQSAQYDKLRNQFRLAAKNNLPNWKAVGQRCTDAEISLGITRDDTGKVTSLGTYNGIHIAGMVSA